MYIIQGGETLSGEIRVQGSKNSSLPILAATILNGSKNTICDVPKIKDIEVMNQILLHLGADIVEKDNVIEINTENVNKFDVPEQLMRRMRSSIVLMGALLGRFGKAKVSYPGGCEIGPRPIDLHLKGLSLMGVNFTEGHGFLYAKASELKGAEIHLDFPSVGATENLMLAGVLAKGTTIIRNVAKEPEIVDLQNFLNRMGANVKGAGTDTIKIEGCRIQDLKQVNNYTIIPDRIAAGTYLVAAAITRGQIKLTNVIVEHLEPILAKLRETGCVIVNNKAEIELYVDKPLVSLDSLRTLPYPGFPTDMQAPMMALLATVEGTSILTETIFENRFKHAQELRRMGANITINGNTAIIKGVKQLSGAIVEAKDLRAGAALILAALAAKGETIVEGAAYVERGYENIEGNLAALGAKIIKKHKI
ncbi:MAG TPA: UDP-N-acetylglucosamine 1-carboxyvinyltransferase [Thermoanaerobacterales bacterium]|uniref:UDP-N-acetylglucosamine 1-carboxyvinyltransferase n=1 Tax=Tepidanaerobacter sp. GT38 TaxID=2722793 RepID=UPI0017D9E96B|nr:UDP-N-acetylglucosamine 1-carboxyvinyltransferase [Tepidanaerobacter sp. GT38]MCG1012169.1 UDP-N-acetylglucosamine 1-carboxyvinyltransferase [Tepidanaerobacter sp. GT38]HHY42371.1 UDP-N-acetylglucosamine 1-carboxyvinyltransferase [Thermoanaerobacterales bacterium]